MPEVHLTCGYMGFGKTTFAKKLEKELPAVRLTHDDFMYQIFGRDMPEEQFRHYYIQVYELMWQLAEKIVQAGSNVIIDYSPWSKERRKEAYERAIKFCPKVIFDEMVCDLEVAKQRVLHRTETDNTALFIDENCFNKFLDMYEPISDDEGLTVIRHSCQ